MIIQLGEKTGMWFLGEPRNLKVSLTLAKLSTEIDFEKLTLLEQKQVLIALKQGKITTTTSYNDLYKIYEANELLTLQQKEEQEKIEKQTKKQTIVNQKVSQTSSKEENHSLLEEKGSAQVSRRRLQAKEIVALSFRACIEAISKVNDPAIWRFALEEEQATKKRKHVIAALKEKLRKNYREVSKILQTSEKQPPVFFREEEKSPLVEDVVEYQEDTLTFTLDELKALAE